MDVLLVHVRVDIRESIADEAATVALVDASADREHGLLVSSPRVALVMLSGSQRRSIGLARRCRAGGVSVAFVSVGGRVGVVISRSFWLGGRW